MKNLKNNLNKSAVIILVCLGTAQAQTIPDEYPSANLSTITKQEILNEMKKYEKQDDLEYEKVIVDMNKKFLDYTEYRQKECIGEFASIELNETGESQIRKNRLNKEEKKLCLLELINFRKTFTKSLFLLRKKQLLKQHADQIKNLEELEGEALAELEKMSAKLK